MSSDPPQGYILVVDDNEMNRDMLSRRLQRQQHSVDVAEDGEVALDMMRNNNFDLVLLDIMMPKLNGYEVLEIAKADPTLQRVPIIMISAVDDLDSVVRCIEMGAEDYLFKPFNPVLLKARVNASLSRYLMSKQSSGACDPQIAVAADSIIQDVKQIRELADGQLNSAHSDFLSNIEAQAKLIHSLAEVFSGP